MVNDLCYRFRFYRYYRSQYRLKVTVDDLLSVQHLQAPEESMGEPTDESDAEALEVVFFY